ncbi:MAG: hypothetical protein ABII07_05515 [Patescibacteria group bacterium]|nr:hypothetical protein [Patescibacteria group bacterium]
MKICLYLQRRFSFLGHNIAMELKNSYGAEEFCCYVYGRYAEKFIKDQSDIEYSEILVEEDLHKKAEEVELDMDFIKKFEEEYGLPNAWPYLLVDRHIMMSVPKSDYSKKPSCSHEKMLKYLQVEAKAMIAFLEKEKPDAVIFALVGSLGSMVLYHVAKKMGIKTINIEPARIKGYITVTDNCYCSLSNADKLFDKLQAGEVDSKFEKEAEDFLKESREKEVRYSWVKDLMNKKKIGPLKFLLLEIKGFIQHSINYYRKSKGDYIMQKPSWFLSNKIVRLCRRIRGYKKLYSKPDLNEDFVFFPMHQDPEIATLLLSPFHIDQVNLIEDIAKSLPVHFKLYVKDHPAMLYSRPMREYKRIKRIPNVELIDPNYSSIKLTKASKLVTTITGTAGFEGVVLKKPIITFGEVFYNKLSMVKRVRCMEDLPSTIKDILRNHKHDDEELKNFIAAILETSEVIDYNKLWNEMDEDKKEIAKFAKLFARELGLKKTS